MTEMEHEHNHIIPYKTFLLVLAVLIALTLISVALTSIHFGALTVFVALSVAVVKSYFVLRIFMHLKLESKMLAALTIGVSVLVAFVIIGTMADYIFR
jgi:cytochrome c oxidase subunit IV